MKGLTGSRSRTTLARTRPRAQHWPALVARSPSRLGGGRCSRWPTTPTSCPRAGAAVAYIGVALAWGFVAAGVFAWLRRPDNRTGPLMIAVGLATVTAGLQFSDAALPFVLGALFDTLIVALLVHLLLAFPSGRLDGRAARVTVAAGYVMATVLHAPQVLLGDEHGIADAPGRAPTCAARARARRRARGAPRHRRAAGRGAGAPRAGSSAAGSTRCCCSAR